MKRVSTLPSSLSIAITILLPSFPNLAAAPLPQAGTIITVAGSGKDGYSGDGGPALKAAIHTPFWLCLDAAGNLFIADWSNNRVRKLSRTGIITTEAGSGPSGLDHSSAAGDGGPALKARLTGPWGVAVNAAGDLFIADEFNCRIRKVDRGRIITTVVGTGAEGHSGDDGPATKARLDRPRTVAIDAGGNLYFVEFEDSCVRKVSPAGTITTVAGTGMDSSSADGGPAAKAMLKTAWGLAVDTAGNLFISEMDGNRIRKVDLKGTITTVAGTGEEGYSGDGGLAVKARLHGPMGIAVDTAGNLFIADSFNERVRRVTPAGTIATVAGTGEVGSSGDGGPATSAQVSMPNCVAIDGRGNLFIGEMIEARIREVIAAAAPGLLAGKPFPMPHAH